MPMIGTGAGFSDPRRPKYVETLAGFVWDLVDYGPEPACFVGVQDIDSETHAALIENADVAALPADLTQQIGTQLAVVQKVVSEFNIPEHWIKATLTYLQVLRVILLMFLFMQRLHGSLPSGRIFSSDEVTLATPINQLPMAVRTAWTAAATSLGFDIAGLAEAATLRVALRSMADQFSTMKINAFGTTL